jgi:glycosyl transferase, family 25
MSAFDFLDAIVYINLDRRPDRLANIQREIQQIQGFPPEKIHRQPGFDEHLAGCLRSHKAAIDMARKNKWTNVLIFEDDFTWRENANDGMEKVKRFWEKHHHEFGFLQLAHLGLAKLGHPKLVEEGVFQITSGTNGAAYLVHNRAYNSLSQVWGRAYPLLAMTKEHWRYMNDVVWNSVRREFPTYALVPALGYQYGDYSDLARCEVADKG